MDKHFNMYEDVVRVPMILRWPGRIPAGARRDAFVSGSVDIAATILEAAGIEKPDTFAGESLLPMATDPGLQPREYAFAQYFGTESGAYSMRMIRDRRYKLVYHPVGDLDEFYDLEEDPGELHNLLAPEHTGRREAAAPDLARLRKALLHTMRERNDPLANRWTAVELGDTPNQPAG
ncbi:MAG: sulfatase-like hydrolase/transferase [Verrucomicrobia bacterium]|jgi:arylsulfatase A-like enzyme|nr:sulfatase-like hydrolase/transferase [Verrucomicrobiota bacterium]